MKKIFAPTVKFFTHYPLLLILLITALKVFLHRWVFLEAFDADYMRELFNSSQWRVSQSPRVMGDNELFPYAGYELIKGGNPFDINPETPPLGKYFLGLSIKLFNNPAILNIPLFIFTSLVFYHLSKFVFKTKAKQGLALFIFLLSPIIVAQVSLKLLDLPQLFVLLSHILAIFYLAKAKNPKHKILFALLAGVFSGAFLAVKPGVFIFAIILADAWVLKKRKKLFWLAPIIALAPVIYLLSYFQYFVLNHSITSWLKAQKWIVNFYTSSSTAPTPHLFVTSLFGFYQGWWEDQWHGIEDWSLVWLLGIVALLGCIWRKFKHKQTNNIFFDYTLVLSLGLIITYLLIPFWPRYLILLTPFLILTFVAAFHRLKSKLQSMVLIIIIVQALIAIMPQQQDLATLASQYWTRQDYFGLYSLLDSDFKFQVTRKKFVKIMEKASADPNIQNKVIRLNFPQSLPWQTQATGQLTQEFDSAAGKQQNTTQAIFVKEHNRWRLKWQWNYLGVNFTPESVGIEFK